jgi:2-oxoglutarate ferredoxin oxidoreductase subunit gamma
METGRQEARRSLEDRYEFRLAGEGGQGMILAGVILAEAAAVYDGRSAVQTQSYGPEARGGASRSEVIIAEGEIDYPKVMAADLLLCMSQEACDKFYTQVKDEGCIAVPFGEIAEQVTGRRITASMVALGFVSGLTSMVTKEALGSAVRERVPAGTEEMNLKALEAGFEEAVRLRRAHGDQPCP